MRIRRAIEGDVAPLLRLIQALTREDPYNGLSLMNAGFLRRQLFHRTPPAFACVVADDGRADLLGFATYWLVPSTDGCRPSASTMRVMAMFIAPEARARRVGEALMLATARDAVALGCEALAWRNWVPDAEVFATYLEARVDGTGTEYRLAAAALAHVVGAWRNGAAE